MTPTPAALAAAEEIMKRVESERVYVNSLDELSFDFAHDIAEIIDRHTAPKPVTDADVSVLLQARIAAVLETTSYASLTISINGFNATFEPKPIFRVVTGEVMTEGEGMNFDQAIAQIRQKESGKTEVELFRQRAAFLISRADALEAKGAGA